MNNKVGGVKLDSCSLLFGFIHTEEKNPKPNQKQKKKLHLLPTKKKKKNYKRGIWNAWNQKKF